MTNIWDIWQYCLIRLNKHQSGRTITIPEFNLVASVVNWVYFKVKVGLPEQYRPGMPFPPQAWQVSQKITDDARQFLVWMGGPDNAAMAVDKYGIADVPADYVAFSSCYYNYITQKNCGNDEQYRAVEFLADAVWADRQSSVIKGPEKKYPIAKWFGDKIQFLPKDLRAVNFTYLREPATPVLAYTVDGNNDPVYDAANSTQFEWPLVCWPDLANYILEIMAENLKSQLDIQMAAQHKIQGQ